MTCRWVHLFLKYNIPEAVEFSRHNTCYSFLNRVYRVTGWNCLFKLQMCQRVTLQTPPPILWGAISTAALVPVWFGGIIRVCVQRSEDIREQLAYSGGRWQRPVKMMQTTECREWKSDNRGDETPLKSASSVIVRHHYEEKRTVIGSQPLMDFARDRVWNKMTQIVPKDGIFLLRSGNSHNYVSAHNLSQNKTGAGAIITFLYFHWLCSFWRVFLFFISQPVK